MVDVKTKRLGQVGCWFVEDGTLMTDPPPRRAARRLQDAIKHRQYWLHLHQALRHKNGPKKLGPFSMLFLGKRGYSWTF